MQFDADTHENNEDYAELKKKRGYSFEDCIEISRDKLPNYDEKVMFLGLELMMMMILYDNDDYIFFQWKGFQ